MTSPLHPLRFFPLAAAQPCSFCFSEMAGVHTDYRARICIRCIERILQASHPNMGGNVSTAGPVSTRNWLDKEGRPAGGVASGVGFAINWQDGPLGQGADRKPPNGAFVEDVLYACLGRLRFYQDSEFGCDENGDAIGYIVDALNRLEERTRRRIAAGVEGTHAK